MVEITKIAQERIAAAPSGSSFAAGMIARMNMAAAGAIGKPFAIQLDKKRSVTGVISKCEIADVSGSKTGGIIGAFNVWMKCGIAQVEKGPFRVTRIPGI
jgi:hypothetical protein